MLTVSPSAGDVPTDIDVPVTAFVIDKLPSGATVAWEWTHSGAGHIATSSADDRPGAARIVVRTGSTDGVASITVRAVVHMPADAGGPARSIASQAARATLSVRRGLREIRLYASQGVFSCGGAADSPDASDYTAFIVPVFADATLYQSEHSNADGRIHRVESWTTPKPDRGGNSWPITHHPFPGSRHFWAVWTGLGEPPDRGDRCRVTVTLRA